LTEVIFWK